MAVHRDTDTQLFEATQRRASLQDTLISTVIEIDTVTSRIDVLLARRAGEDIEPDRTT
jgi:hypothetical protein